MDEWEKELAVSEGVFEAKSGGLEGVVGNVKGGIGAGVEAVHEGAARRIEAFGSETERTYMQPGPRFGLPMCSISCVLRSCLRRKRVRVNLMRNAP